MVNNPLANAGNARYAGSVPGSGRPSGGGNGNQLQYSCLENPMDRGVPRATVHGIAESWTQLSHTHTHLFSFGRLIKLNTFEMRILLV